MIPCDYIMANYSYHVNSYLVIFHKMNINHLKRKMDGPHFNMYKTFFNFSAMDFSLYAIPGDSLKNTISANLKYFVQKDQRATNIKTIETGLITLLDHCPIFQFSTSPLEEFNRPFYSNWTCSTSI